jgi:alpha-amylase/alpha-mannosidase (GH57 family)
MSPDVTIYCQVHQPFRLRRFCVFDVGTGRGWFDDKRNAAIVRRVVDKCYLPASRLLTDAVRRSGGRFKLALSLTGTLLEQLSAWAPDALVAFQELAATGQVELLGETYYHSLAALADPEEFAAQVVLYREAIARLVGQRPTVFRNTELIYDDAIGPMVARLGYRDYESFGEHQWADTGIFEFLRHLPDELARRGMRCALPSELAERAPVAPLSFPVLTSWADIERDTSACLGNRMQRAARERVYRIGRRIAASGDGEKLAQWRKLTNSDHFYYMCTKWFADCDVHKYFNPYDSPCDAFVAAMNVLTDLERSLSAPAPVGREAQWAGDGEMAVVA